MTKFLIKQEIYDKIDVSKAFSILTKKLGNVEKSRKGYGPKNREDVLKFEDFERLFEFDLKKVGFGVVGSFLRGGLGRKMILTFCLKRLMSLGTTRIRLG